MYTCFTGSCVPNHTEIEGELCIQLRLLDPWERAQDMWSGGTLPRYCVNAPFPARLGP
jgi:hypothetical protein